MKGNFFFGFDETAWPVLLVDSAGTIQRLNNAAQEVFGIIIEPGDTHLSSVWAAENDLSASDFVQNWNQAPRQTAMVKYVVKGGVVIALQTWLSPVHLEEQRYMLMQVFHSSSVTTGAGSGNTAFLEKSGVKPEALDAGLAHKQKLDCALQLARTVALDFNNALTSILGHTSLVLSKMEPCHPWRNSLVEVEKSAERAAEIAHDLAVFSRQEKDTRTVTAGNLNELLRRAVESFRANTPAQIEWKLHLENKPYAANFDEAKMQQAFIKVLENAVQACRGPGRIIVISRNRDLDVPTTDGAAKLAAGCYICIEVSDSGTGIPPEILPRIFEPFFTTKQGHRGLGLAWVYGIVTNHGGSISVSSTVGTGTTVRIYLPAQKKLMHDHAALNDEELRGTQTILFVDDEDILLTMAETILSAYGYKVITANSGQKALELLANPANQVDLVITDLVMPHMSGRELIEHMRVFLPEIPIICATGYVRSGGESDEGYLQKPFTSQGLLLKVKQTLSKIEGQAAT